MEIAPRYHINNPKIVHETIEGETVIVDLATGSYYSLVGVGSLVWNELAAGRTVQQILEQLTNAYDAAPGDIETALQALLQELVREQLVTFEPPAETPPFVESASAKHRDPTGERAHFVAPHLTKFSDMQELLLLDPVHDVDETGWPHTDNAVRG